MPNNRNQLVPIFNELHAIDYNLEKKLPELLNKASATRTLNAWVEGTVVDGKGQVWIIENFLASIWRTDSSTANFFVDRVTSSDKVNFDGKLCVKYSSVIYRLNEIIQSPTSHKRREYLRISEDIGRAVRDSTPVEVIRLRYYEFMEETKKRLKHQRIKQYQIDFDELTNLPLDITSSEFHHIRRQSSSFDMRGYIWNGLIVSKDTHNVITHHSVSDEYDLKELCLKMNWSTDWFKRYEEDLKLLESN
jgi:hypothetical protein